MIDSELTVLPQNGLFQLFWLGLGLDRCGGHGPCTGHVLHRKIS